MIGKDRAALTICFLQWNIQGVPNDSYFSSKAVRQEDIVLQRSASLKIKLSTSVPTSRTVDIYGALARFVILWDSMGCCAALQILYQ